MYNNNFKKLSITILIILTIVTGFISIKYNNPINNTNIYNDTIIDITIIDSIEYNIIIKDSIIKNIIYEKEKQINIIKNINDTDSIVNKFYLLLSE